MSIESRYPSMAPAAPDPEPVAETMLTDAPVQPADTPPTDEPHYLAMRDAPEQPPAPAPAADDANPLESNLPDAVRELREADPNRRLYSAQKTYASDLPDADFEAVVGKEGPDGKPFTQERAVQAATEWREIAADLELSTADVRELVPVFKNPPTPEQQAANRSASLQWLVAEHGDRAAHVLELARALVARDPRTAALLDFGGGDDPRVVKKIVASALRQAASGKLKLKK